mgnify:CR=1 FL=1
MYDIATGEVHCHVNYRKHMPGQQIEWPELKVSMICNICRPLIGKQLLGCGCFARSIRSGNDTQNWAKRLYHIL